MLERFQKIAIRMWSFRYLLVMLGLIGLGGFAASVFELQWFAEYQLMMPSLVLFFWAAGGLCFSSLFMDLPTPVSPDAGFVARGAYKLRRAFYWVLAAALIALSSAVLLISYQLIRTWTLL